VAENIPHAHIVNTQIVTADDAFTVEIEALAYPDSVSYPCTLFPFTAIGGAVLNGNGGPHGGNAGIETYLHVNGDGHWEDDYIGCTEVAAILGTEIEKLFIADNQKSNLYA